MQGRVVVEEGAELINSFVRGPAIIGRGTRLIDTFVGPYTSIYHSCHVEDSEIEQLDRAEQTVIKRIHRLEDSLIGKQVEVARSDR